MRVRIRLSAPFMLISFHGKAFPGPLKKSSFPGCSKRARCKVPEILRVASRRISPASRDRHAGELVSRAEAYLAVRRNKPAPCSTRGRMREIPRSAGLMAIFQQPANSYKYIHKDTDYNFSSDRR